MRAARLGVESGMLRSKVARRMFSTFIVCALLPVLALSLIAFFDVKGHLDAESASRLHQASKSDGMTIVERVSFLESDLHLMAVDLEQSRPRAGASRRHDVGDGIGRRFTSLAVFDSDGRLLTPLSGPPLALPPLTPRQRDHLRTTGTLVATVPRDGRVAVIAAVEFDLPTEGTAVLAGEVDPDYLWGGDVFGSPGIERWVVDEAGRMLYTSMPGGVPLAEMRAAAASDPGRRRFEWTRNGRRYAAASWTIFMRPRYFVEWTIVESESWDAAHRPLTEFGLPFSLIVLSTFLVVTFASLRQIRRSTVPIEQLMEATQKIRGEDFSHRVTIESRDEFAALGEAFNEMTDSIARHLRVMATMNHIGAQLSVEKDEARLLETVLSGAQAVFNADGAGLFLLTPEGPQLALAQVASIGFRYAESDQRPAGSGRPNQAAIMATLRTAADRTIASPDIYAEDAEDFAALLDFDRRVGYRTRSYLSVPLRNHENEVIGVLLLVNAQSRTTGAVVPFSADDERLLESLASQAAVAITKNRLVQDFKGLFEGLTDLVSTAIDEQSPHTGGHVRRVVALSTMIAEALPRSRDDEVRAAALSDEQLYELRIAALLHDCGKLTTPVHLTDKATKLQAIVDRMRFVEARAETARREFRGRLLEDLVRRKVAGGDAELAAVDAAAGEFDETLRLDLDAIRACNRGHEEMPDDTWARARETADRYQWIDLNGEPCSLVSPDEMYHLGTRSGTLTPEEREIVKGHVLSTLRMLEQLPYPKPLRNVPVYAAAHHERMSGDGYPFHLQGNEIPIQGRIIAVADVLEALTARDRPYRNAMSLDEAVEVLGRLAGAGSLDAGLYRLVMSERIHERYAREFLGEPAGTPSEPRPQPGALATGRTRA